MKPLVRAALTAAALASGAAWLPVARQAPAARPFNVAIVQAAEGVSHLEPIARFTGTEWLNTWPAPGDTNAPVPALDKIPDAWLGKPVPREWVVWSPAGHTRARVTGTRRGDACEALVQLTLDAVPMKGRDHALVAVDADQAVGGIRAIMRTDAEWAPLAAIVTATFRANEARAGDESPRLKDQVTPQKLAGVTLAIDYFVRPVSADVALLYYFEATKRLPATTTGDQLGVAVSGWLRREARGGWVAADVTSRVLGEDSNPVPERAPLATFRLAGRDYWLIDIRGYEGSAASIVEVTASGIRDVVTIPRAGC